MENTQDVNAPPGERTSDQVREELFRMLDEVVSGRGDRSGAVTARFKALWKKVCGNEEGTVH
jgi:hypothetical protein